MTQENENPPTPEDDPQLAAVRSIIRGAALEEPGSTLLTLFQALLRYLRDSKQMPLLPISFDDLEASWRSKGGRHGLGFGINHVDRYVVVFLEDGATRAGVVGQSQARMPHAKVEVIDEMKGPKV